MLLSRRRPYARHTEYKTLLQKVQLPTSVIKFSAIGGNAGKEYLRKITAGVVALNVFNSAIQNRTSDRVCTIPVSVA